MLDVLQLHWNPCADGGACWNILHIAMRGLRSDCRNLPEKEDGGDRYSISVTLPMLSKLTMVIGHRRPRGYMRLIVIFLNWHGESHISA